MAGHAQLKFVMTECSKTQIRLTRLIYEVPMTLNRFVIHLYTNKKMHTIKDEYSKEINLHPIISTESLY